MKKCLQKPAVSATQVNLHVYSHLPLAIISTDNLAAEAVKSLK
jgi:hypothetical protein